MVCLTVKVGKCSSSTRSNEANQQPCTRLYTSSAQQLTFLAVQDLSSVLLLHLLGAQALVDDLPLDLLITLTVVGDGLQKGRRTTSRSGEDETHLTRSQETGKVGEKVTGFGGHGVDAEDLEDLEDGHDELLDDGVGEGSDVDLCRGRGKSY